MRVYSYKTKVPNSEAYC